MRIQIDFREFGQRNVTFANRIQATLGGGLKWGSDQIPADVYFASLTARLTPECQECISVAEESPCSSQERGTEDTENHSLGTEASVGLCRDFLHFLCFLISNICNH